MVVEGFQRIFTEFQESVPLGTYPRNTVVIPDHENWRKTILPDVFRVWFKWGSPYHEGHHWHGAISGRNQGPCDIRLDQQHLCQQRCRACNPHQRTPGSIWVGLQGPRTVGGQFTGTGIGYHDRMRSVAVEARKCGSWRLWCRHVTDIILFVWEACQAPLSVSLALCGL